MSPTLAKEDSAVRARQAGKESVAMRTAWLLEVGAYRVRCVYLRPDFEVQLRTVKGTWCPLGRGKDPSKLLLRLIGSDTWQGLISGTTDAIVNRKVKP